MFSMAKWTSSCSCISQFAPSGAIPWPHRSNEASLMILCRSYVHESVAMENTLMAMSAEGYYATR